MTTETELKLEAHERECAIRYGNVESRLESLDKRLWRLEAMVMGSTITIISLAAVIFARMT
jgi:hypothetical protein